LTNGDILAILEKCIQPGSGGHFERLICAGAGRNGK
jgi:hypothetical protein